MRESGDMLSEAQRILFRGLREVLNSNESTIQKLREAMTEALQPFLFEQTKRHPMIVSMVLTPDED
jgi:ribonuclease J